MTTLDSRTQHEPRPAPHHGGTTRIDDDSAAHVLRLCLDLQLDAMLLTVGATGACATGLGTGLPWRRWLGEDVDLACALAADTLAGGAALPSTLGTELDHHVPAATIDTLTALFESMHDRLSGLLAATSPDAGPVGRSGFAGTTGEPDGWRPRLQEALNRCETRLAELQDHRLDVTPARGIRVREEHHYLPGELLG